MKHEDIIVLEETDRIWAPDIRSEHEKNVMAEIFDWAASEYGSASIGMDFEQLAEAFWAERLEEVIALRAVIDERLAR